jgi:CheY-like chemotaxis protein
VDHRAVLLVEDSEDDAILLQQAFKELCATPPIHWVKNGNDAILYLCGDGCFTDRKLYPIPSLVLLDLKMPIKNGFEVLRWARSYPAYATIPIVVLSDCFDERIIQRAYELGANSYLRKPRDKALRLTIVQNLNNYWLALNTSATGAGWRQVN